MYKWNMDIDHYSMAWKYTVAAIYGGDYILDDFTIEALPARRNSEEPFEVRIARVKRLLDWVKAGRFQFAGGTP
jgi:hypothetical protein